MSWDSSNVSHTAATWETEKLSVGRTLGMKQNIAGVRADDGHRGDGDDEDEGDEDDEQQEMTAAIVATLNWTHSSEENKR